MINRSRQKKSNKALQKTIGENMDSIRDIVNLAVSKKREGKFKEAIQLYEEALRIDSEDAIIYTSLAKSQYLNNQKSDALSNYIIGLAISIVNYANQNGYSKSNIRHDNMRKELVSNFFSTTGHLAHAYIDLDKEGIEGLVDSITQAQASLSRKQIQQIVNYTILDYKFVLAGGGIQNEPKYHGIAHDLSFIEIYKHYGEGLAMYYLNWDSISNSLHYE